MPQSKGRWNKYEGEEQHGKSTLRCYTLDVREFIFHGFKIFNSSLFQLIYANDKMGLMSRMNLYIETLC
jgi:hypothetical protein